MPSTNLIQIRNTLGTQNSCSKFALTVLDDNGTPANIRIYELHLTIIICLHFAADNMDNIFVEVIMVGSVELFYFCKSDVSVVQGHPR